MHPQALGINLMESQNKSLTFFKVKKLVKVNTFPISLVDKEEIYSI